MYLVIYIYVLRAFLFVCLFVFDAIGWQMPQCKWSKGLSRHQSKRAFLKVFPLITLL